MMRPEYVNCVDCGAPIKVGKRGRLPTRCRGKAYERHGAPRATQCGYCERECVPSRNRMYSHCDECVRNGRAKKDTRLRQSYGITLRQYEELWKRQGGKCGICPKRLSQRTACTDHDHKTGKVRGLLCHHCNRALGTFGDDLNGIMKVVEYLKSPPARFTH